MTVLWCDAVEGDVKSPEESGNIMDAYRQLWQVVKLPAVKRFAFVLVTFRYPFSVLVRVPALINEASALQTPGQASPGHIFVCLMLAVSVHADLQLFLHSVCTEGTSHVSFPLKAPAEAHLALCEQCQLQKRKPQVVHSMLSHRSGRMPLAHARTLLFALLFCFNSIYGPQV